MSLLGEDARVAWRHQIKQVEGANGFWGQKIMHFKDKTSWLRGEGGTKPAWVVAKQGSRSTDGLYGEETMHLKDRVGRERPAAVVVKQGRRSAHDLKDMHLKDLKGGSKGSQATDYQR